ncbi:hypothetical protein DM02DRAFT_485897, partial [Periconia macrospinosa]
MGFEAQIMVLMCCLTLSSHAAFVPLSKAPELSFADLPSCSLQCTVTNIPESNCALTDIECVCQDKGFAQAVALCMLEKCNMRDIERSVKVQASICHLSSESRRHQTAMYLALAEAFATAFIILRIAGKYVSKRLGKDDLLLVVTYLLSFVTLGTTIMILHLGFGEHIWNLKEGNLLRILRLYWISAIIYIGMLAMLKTTLILFYLEFFTFSRFRFIAYGVTAYIFVNTAIIIFLAGFICRPLQMFWNRGIKTGKCMDIPTVGNVVSGSAIAQDIILLILPLAFLHRLHMPLSRKIGLTVIFCVGIFGCIATTIRLLENPKFKISLDPTWEYVPGTIWTVVELAAIYGCVSLPSIRIFLVYILPDGFKASFSKAVKRWSPS